HFECAVFMYGCSVIKELKKDALKTFEMSHRVTVADRKKGFIRQVLGGLIDSVLRVFAPLF
ncbi:MAG: cardiolipin synthase, partial [Clostridiales bacterium]|nr:cardiolipin synthase [Clostridiales bacterium]